MPKKIHQLQKNIFKFILLGSNGLLGNELKKILPKKQTLTISRKKADLNIDLRNFLRIENTFKKLKFKNVINCAAITNLTLCERKKKRLLFNKSKITNFFKQIIPKI